MKEDRFVKQARAAGQAHIDSFKGDWPALRDDLNRRAFEEGRKLISREIRTTPRRRKKPG